MGFIEAMGPDARSALELAVAESPILPSPGLLPPPSPEALRAARGIFLARCRRRRMAIKITAAKTERATTQAPAPAIAATDVPPAEEADASTGGG